MAIALYILVEGDTEERFANQVLVPHLVGVGVCAYVSKVVTRGRRGNHEHQGGGRTYGKWKNDLTTWIKQQHHRSDVWFTTMLDFYGLSEFSDGFPAYAEHAACTDAYQRVENLEAAWARDVGFHRFVPYLQLHEFEALVLVDTTVLKARFLDNEKQVDQLAAAIAGTRQPPELINDRRETSPSHRIASFVPAYARQKADAGSSAARTIGLARLRGACPHFDRWISRLEQLDKSAL